MTAPSAVPERLSRLKARLDALRPLKPRAAAALDAWFDREFTWASNALEGNTLTAAETTLVIERGITVSGKPLRDHLEAVDGFEALGRVREVARGSAPVGERTVLELHRRIVARSRPEIAGRYALLPRRIAGSAAVFPSPAKIPDLMARFGAELSALDPADPRAGFGAHWRLVAVHPFEDGNGRTARLLANLLLLRGGWPPVSVSPAERPAHLAALEASLGGAGGGRAVRRLHAGAVGGDAGGLAGGAGEFDGGRLSAYESDLGQVRVEGASVRLSAPTRPPASVPRCRSARPRS